MPRPASERAAWPSPAGATLRLAQRAGPHGPARRAAAAPPLGRRETSRPTAAACGTSQSTRQLAWSCTLSGERVGHLQHRLQLVVAHHHTAVADGSGAPVAPRRAEGRRRCHDVLAVPLQQPVEALDGADVTCAVRALEHVAGDKLWVIGARRCRCSTASPSRREVGVAGVVHQLDHAHRAAGRRSPRTPPRPTLSGTSMCVDPAQKPNARSTSWPSPAGRPGRAERSRSTMDTGLTHSCRRSCNGRSRYHITFSKRISPPSRPCQT